MASNQFKHTLFLSLRIILCLGILLQTGGPLLALSAEHTPTPTSVSHPTLPLQAQPPRFLPPQQSGALEEIPLSPGWNLLSIPRTIPDTDPTAVFANITGQYNTAYAYDGCAAEPWQVYDPAATPGSSDLTTIDHTRGFWLEATTNTTLPLTNTLPVTTAIQLCQGWNLIGLPLAQSRPLHNALASIAGKYNLVLGYNPDNALYPWEGYDRSAPDWANDLQLLHPGRGYWVYATENTTLHFANAGEPPLVDIITPAETAADLPTLTTLTDIIGTVQSDLLQEWTLAYRPANTNQWTTLASGLTSVTAATLGQFDPTLLLNGLYDLRLTATDYADQTQEDMVTVFVDGAQKIGHVTLSFLDMSIPVRGIPIDLIRTYDSRDRQTGDFGAGWTLSTRQDVRIQENTILGQDWQLVPNPDNNPFQPFCLEPVGPHVVVVLINNEVLRFRPTTNPKCGTQAEFTLTELGFTPLPGTQAELAPISNNIVTLLSGQLLDNGSPVDYSQYRLTYPSGSELEIEQGFGLRKIEDTDGNSISITENSITHQPSGIGITIERDGDNRITQITDPLNYTMHYAYDANGDLVAVTNQISETTQFTYLADHYLHTIIDPSGVEIAAVDYTPEGRVNNLCDFENNCSQMGYSLINNQEVITDATGIVTTLIYDERGNVIEQRDNDGYSTYMVYDENDNLLQMTDPNGIVTRYAYNEDGNMAAATSPFDPTDPTTIFTTTYEYDPNNVDLLTRLTNPRGGQINFAYDASGNLTEMRDTQGNLILEQTYGAGGIITSERDPFTTTYYDDFDVFGNAGVMTDTNGTTTFTYDGMGNLTHLVIDNLSGPNLTRTVTYDGLGQETSNQILSGMGVSTFTYDESHEGWATEFNGPTGDYTLEQVFAPNGRLESYTEDNISVQYQYDAAGRLLGETNTLGQTTTYQYDTVGRPMTITHPDGVTLVYQYDPGGRPTHIIDENGDSLSISYHPNGQPAVLTDTLGHVWRYEYTADTTTLIDPLQRSHTTQVSPEGLVTAQINPDGTTKQYEYLLASPLVGADDYPTRLVDESGRERLYTYTDLGELTTATDLAGQTYTYAYDQGDLISITNPISEVVMAFEYDTLGYISAVHYPNGRTRSFANDVIGQPLTITHPSGTTVVNTYDEAGNHTAHLASTGEAHYFTYDAYNTLTETVDNTGVTRYTYDDVGQLTAIDYPTGMHIAYGYDILGRVITLSTQISPTAVVRHTTYQYDAGGNLTGIQDPLGGQTTIAYDALGRPITRTLPNGVTTLYTYHPLRDWVTSIHHLDSSDSTLAQAIYEYAADSLGEPEKITREDGTYVQLTYNTSLQLSSETYYDANDLLLESIHYTYDAVGNRLVVTDTIGIHAYTYDPGSELTQINHPTDTEMYDHDLDGRLTLLARQGMSYTLSYDSRDHLTGVVSGTDTIQYTYDAMDRRVSATDPTGSRHFLVAPMASSPLESPHLIMDDTGTLLAGYVYAGSQPLMRFDAAGNPTYYLEDSMGSILALANDAGAGVAAFHYDSFGNIRSGSAPTDVGGDFRFHGAWLESATQLYHFRARDYDAHTGRFLSRDMADPILKRPETLNPYVFVLSNPYIYTDPSGYTTLIDISAGHSIQNILRSVVKDYIKEWIKDEIKGRLMSIAIEGVISPLFRGILSYSGGKGDGWWGSVAQKMQKGKDDGGYFFESYVMNIVCDFLEGSSYERYLWFEVQISGGNAASNGQQCSQKRNYDPAGPQTSFPLTNPDFLFSQWKPKKLNGGSRRGWVIGDIKLASTSTKSTQTAQMAMFAKKNIWGKNVLFIFWSTPKDNAIKSLETQVNAYGAHLRLFSIIPTKNSRKRRTNPRIPGPKYGL